MQLNVLSDEKERVSINFVQFSKLSSIFKGNSPFKLKKTGFQRIKRKCVGFNLL
jgi:hypothetical protein